jgi:hypothetical protein
MLVLFSILPLAAVAQQKSADSAGEFTRDCRSSPAKLQTCGLKIDVSINLHALVFGPKSPKICMAALPESGPAQAKAAAARANEILGWIEKRPAALKQPWDDAILAAAADIYRCR